MLRGGQTPSWTCQMVFNPAHCPRSSAPSSSPSLCLLSFSGMLASFCSPLPPFLSPLHPTQKLLFSHPSLISFLTQHFYNPGISLFFLTFSTFFSPVFLAHGTWSLVSNTFNFLKYITPSPAWLLHRWSQTQRNTHTHNFFT